MSRICEMAEIRPKTLYDKLNYFHRQALLFSASREHDIPDNPPERLDLCCDRQDYIVNWSDKKVRKTVQLSAVGTADLASGYVFAMHLNFDPRISPVDIAHEVAQDAKLPYPFRRHARLWTDGDYIQSVARSKRRAAKIDEQPEPYELEKQLRRAYARIMGRPDLESPELLNAGQQLPKEGMQIHAEYTLYGHFQYLFMVLTTVKYICFFLDRDAGMKPACLSIFKDLIKEKRAEVLYVKIAKNRTIDERNRMAARAKKRLAAARAAHPNLTDEEIRIELIKRAMPRMRDIGKSGELWMFNPLPSLAEPEKAISYLTDKGHLALDDKAKLYDRASLHSIDTFFMTVRRRLSPLERPISPSRRGRRTWNGYSPYNPATHRPRCVRQRTANLFPGKATKETWRRLSLKGSSVHAIPIHTQNFRLRFTQQRAELSFFLDQSLVENDC